MLKRWLVAFISILFAINFVGCKKIINTVDSNFPLTYSTFTEQSGWQIWQYDIGNDQIQQLTRNINEAYYPSLAPSGLLVYSDHNGKIWLLDSKPSAEKQSAQAIRTLPKYCGHPAISPDGKHLVCACFTFINRSEDSELYMVSLETGQSERLISLPGLQKHPAWSPDGKQLAFSSGYREGGENIVEQLWLLDIAKKMPIKIVDNGSSNIHPSWSPDGKRIAYSSDMNGSLDLWLYDLSSRNSHFLTDLPALESDPDWRPDGKALVYVSTEEGVMGLWEIDINTKQRRKLLSLEEDIHEPVWQ